MGGQNLLRLLAVSAFPLVLALNTYFPDLSYMVQQWLSWRVMVGIGK